MSNHSFDYKQHRVHITVDGPDGDLWCWSYTIDNGVAMPGGTYKAGDDHRAVQQARELAIRDIDLLEDE